MNAPSAIQYFGKAARYYGRTDGMFGQFKAQMYKELLIDVLVPRRGSRLLDVGIGTGSLSLPFLEDGYTIHGIDGAPEMIEQCKRNGLPDNQLVCADMDRYGIPYPNETFRLTITSASLVYMKNAVAVISEMIRVTEKGGVLIIDPHTHINHFDHCIAYNTHPLKPTFYAQSADVIDEIIEEADLGIEAITAECLVKDLAIHPVDGLIQTENVIYVLKRQL